MQMEVSVKKGTEEVKGKKVEIEILVVEIKMNAKPELSASGKSKVVASTHGNQATTVVVDGKPVTIGLNAYIKA